MKNCINYQRNYQITFGVSQFSIIIFLFLLMGCAGKSNSQPVKAPSFVLPEIPTVLTAPKEWAKSEMLQSLQKSGRLKILAFYPDKDLEIREKKWADIPAEWINGCDKNAIVTDRQLYDLKAIPTIYLLDRNKTVILKDVDPKQTLLPGNFGL
jgi:hypothetical protein